MSNLAPTTLCAAQKYAGPENKQFVLIIETEINLCKQTLRMQGI